MKKLHAVRASLPLLLLVLANVFLMSPNYYFPLILKNWPTPLYSTSYYIQNGDPALLSQMGCTLGTRDAATPGKQDSLVILDFGNMWIENGVYGVSTFYYSSSINQFIGLRDLEERVKYFALGYYNCSANDRSSHLTLGIGINNYGFFNQTNRTQDNLRTIAADFGRNWAYMVNRLNSWGLQGGYSGQVLFTGAIDIEWSSKSNTDGLLVWQSAYVVRGWVDAFDAADNKSSIFFNFGACVGCYATPDPNWYYVSPTYWAMPDVYNVSWGSPPAFSVPEIYRNDGFLAKQWAAVSKYGSLLENGSRIIFTGVITQMQACQQRASSDPSCEYLDNTPSEGWGQLMDAINLETFTAQPAIQFSTDIRWQYK